MKAFYFAPIDNKLAYGDGREIVVGETHQVDCKPEICKQGLHGSVRIFDALKYAKSSHLYIVDVDGEISKGTDKIAGKRRKYIAHFDCESVLFEFARKQALINIEKIKPCCSDADYVIIIKFLETGDEKLRSAARSAARSAEWSAARSAARSEARSAAWSAAESEARSEAWSAAWSAAESAARSAEWSAARSAEWSAARSAVDSAARSEANKMLIEMIEKESELDLSWAK